MFRGSEYWLAVIGAFTASFIVGEKLARDASIERCLLEVVDRSDPSLSISSARPMSSARRLGLAQFLRLSNADASPDVKAGP
jgi:hypothetical protein